MKKILIIEDDPIVANVYRNKLAVEGYGTEVAPDGESGLQALRTYKPDLIFIDLMLPGISGVDVIREVRSEEEFAKVPIIVFSNTYLTNLIQEAGGLHANKCLSKSNCTPKEVVEIVRSAIGTSGAMTQKPGSSPAEVAATPKPAGSILRRMTRSSRPTCAGRLLRICLSNAVFLAHRHPGFSTRPTMKWAY